MKGVIHDRGLWNRGFIVFMVTVIIAILGMRYEIFSEIERNVLFGR